MTRRTTGSSGHGIVEWLWQRLTAVYLGMFGVVLLVDLLSHPVHDFAAWQRLFAHPFLRVLWLLAFVAMFLHAWIGVRSVYLDYLHRFRTRFIANVLTAMVMLACGIWLLLVLFGRGI